jgi:hypothetical protein
MSITPCRLAAVLTLLLLASVATRSHEGAQAAGVSLGQTPPPGPVQPLPYSHRTHVALGLQCRTCHVNPDAGKLMTYPDTAICMGCHQAIATERPAIRKLAEYAASNLPIPWVRVYRVPDYVYWRHGTHLEADVPCADCHGPVAERDVIALETNVTTMLGCVTCHDQRQAFTGCVACHQPPQ